MVCEGFCGWSGRGGRVAEGGFCEVIRVLLRGKKNYS